MYWLVTSSSLICLPWYLRPFCLSVSQGRSISDQYITDLTAITRSRQHALSSESRCGISSAHTSCADQVHGWKACSYKGATDILLATDLSRSDSSRASVDFLLLGHWDLGVLPSNATSSFSEEVLGYLALSLVQMACAQLLKP